MATNIGPKIGVEGAAEYRKQMNQIISQAKELDSEMKLVTSTFTKETSAEEKNAKQKQVLTKQIENQKQRVKTLQEQLEKTSQAYGENDARTIKLRTSLNNAQTALNKMENEMNELEKETRESTVQLNSFDRAVLGAADKLPSLGTVAKGAAGVLAGTLAAATAVAAAGIAAVTKAITDGTKAMIDWAKDAGTYADEILTLAQVTSMDTDALQELAYMADLVDVELNTITSSMARNIRSMNQAKDGTGEAAEAYAQLGVAVVDADGNLRDGQEVYWELIDALGKVENETERDALAMTIFGRSAQELNPLILKGSKAVKEYAKQAHDAGAVMNKETLQSLGKMDDSFQRLKQGANAAKRALGATLSPQLTKLADGMSDALGNFSNAVNDADGDTEKMSEAFSTLISDLTTLIIDNMPEIISFAADLIGAIAKAFGENPDKIAEAASALLNALADGILANAGTVTYNTIEIIGKIAEELTKEETLRKIIDSGYDVIVALANGVGDNADEVLMALPRILQAFADSLKDQEQRQEFIDAATNFMTSFSLALADSMDAMAEVIPALAEAFATVLSDPEVILSLWGAASNAATTFWVSFAINSASMPGKMADMWMGMLTGKDNADKYEQAGKDVADDVARGVNKGADRVEEEAEYVADEAYGKFEDVEGDMEGSGRDMMSGMARGLEERGRQVIDAAKRIAEKIAGYLHFSRPDEGPLREYEKWMPDFMKGLSKGIKANEWRVSDAVAGLSSDLSLTLRPGVDPAAASYTNMTTNVGGITVQVYGTEGQSVDALADRVMDKINVTLQNSGRVWA